MSNKKSSHSSNVGNFTRLTNDIIVFDNFISDEESLSVIKLLDEKMEEGSMSWMPISFYESYSSNLPQDGDEYLERYNLPSNFFSNLENRFLEAVSIVHGLDKSTMSKIGFHAQKWEPGAYATPHSDNTDIDGNSGPFERSRYAAFLYLNDNFEGGTLRFTKQQIEILPKTGMLAAFDGGFNNIHEVSIIKKGVRYTIGSFWDDREESDYPEEKRNKWEKEMKEIRDKQEIERKEWQELLKSGYKISKNGKKYRIGEVL
jgi:hypothetical protein